MVFGLLNNYSKTNEELFELMFCSEGENRILIRNQIVEKNLKLVTYCLKQYRPWNDDQFQAGCMGLIAAANKYDPKRTIKNYEGKEVGIQFQTFAVSCIKFEIIKLHHMNTKKLDALLMGDLLYLDAPSKKDDEIELTVADFIEDPNAKKALDTIFEEFNLDVLFESVVYPAILEISEGLRESDKVLKSNWEKAEINYILWLTFGLNKMNLQNIGKVSGCSIEGAKNRHLRSIKLMREKLKKIQGYEDIV